MSKTQSATKDISMMTFGKSGFDGEVVGREQGSEMIAFYVASFLGRGGWFDAGREGYRGY